MIAFNTFGFNNTYTLALDESRAEELGVVTFSDFAKVSEDFILGAVFEFIDRPDGLPGFQKEYGLKFKDVKGMDHGIMYRSINAKEVDVINSYTTDGQLQIMTYVCWRMISPTSHRTMHFRSYGKKRYRVP